ncbi:MAG: hypothetical protein MR905_06875 [Prevotella sp.]|nr:hypothetical protein [Prevotella sp.]
MKLTSRKDKKYHRRTKKGQNSTNGKRLHGKMNNIDKFFIQAMNPFCNFAPSKSKA